MDSAENTFNQKKRQADDDETRVNAVRNLFLLFEVLKNDDRDVSPIKTSDEVMMIWVFDMLSDIHSSLCLMVACKYTKNRLDM